MRGGTDHLELDPLGPMGIDLIADIDPTPGPLELAPLSPLDHGARPTDGHGPHRNTETKGTP